jgi:hypothetical protein
MKEKDLQSMWDEYTRLEEKKMLTPVVISRMIRKESGGELATMIRLGYASLFVFAGLCVLFAITAFLYRSDGRLTASSIGGLALSVLGTWWTLYLLRKMRGIDFMHGTFQHVIEGVRKVRQLFRLEMRMQFIFVPLILACTYPVMYMLVQHINIFESFGRVAVRVIGSYIVITALSIWIYRRYYLRHLDLAADKMNRVSEWTEEVQ